MRSGAVWSAFWRAYACVVPGVAVGVFLALLALNVRNREYYLDDAWNAAYHFALPALLAAASAAALRLRTEARLVVAVHLTAVVVALYAAEAWVTWTQDRGRARTAARLGVEPDARSKVEVLRDLRAAGRRAYPATRAKALLVEDATGALVSPIHTGGTALLPLASVGDATIVSCNETGRWMIYESDAYGFHNPAGAWSRPAGLALVGDSFVQGDCVESQANIAAHLRARGRAVVNLGTAGFGPLEELAALAEHLPAMRPARVLWFYYEGNDLTKDLPVEMRAPRLRAYLERPGFTQGLHDRAGEVSTALAAHLDRRFGRVLAEVDHPRQRLLDFLQLFRLRERLGLDPVGLGIFEPLDDATFALFRGALAEARRLARGWGGQLVFVYLPDSARYFAAARDNAIRDRLRARVLATARGLGLPVIDVHAAFATSGAPRALFHYPGSHYNRRGYRVAADAVAESLRRIASVGAAPRARARAQARGLATPPAEWQR